LQKNSFVPGFSWNGSLSGRAVSIISFLAIEKTVLLKLIPPGLTLADQEITPAGYHPIYLAFNLKQKNVTTPIPGFKLRNYSEFALCIPYLRLKDKADEVHYTYSPVLYLNSLLAVIGGHIFFWLPKILASVLTNSTANGDTTFTSAHFFNRNNFYFKASFKKDGAAIPAFDSENFLALKSMLKQPLIVYHSAKRFRTMNYQMEELIISTIQPLIGNLKTGKFIRGLDNANFQLDSINDTPLGTFRIEYNWRLTKATPITN
jgi:hypothetical protein